MNVAHWIPRLRTLRAKENPKVRHLMELRGGNSPARQHYGVYFCQSGSTLQDPRYLMSMP